MCVSVCALSPSGEGAGTLCLGGGISLSCAVAGGSSNAGLAAAAGFAASCCFLLLPGA